MTDEVDQWVLSTQDFNTVLDNWKPANQDSRVDEVIILAYFLGNYSSVVQDAAQGFHWGNSQ